MNKLIAQSSGHSNVKGKDRGAAGNGYVEGELTVELRDLVEKELDILGAKSTKDKNDTVLSDTLRDFEKKVKEGDIVIDYHWNSATPKATGVETLVSDPSTDEEKRLAQKLSQTVADTLGIPLRGNYGGYKGVKSEKESQHSRLGFLHLKGVNVLLEVCFISNESDMRSYQKNKYVLAKRIAKVLFEAAQGLTNSTTYKVVKGDSLSKIATKYKTTVAELKRLNKLNSDVIQIGQLIKIK